MFGYEIGTHEFNSEKDLMKALKECKEFGSEPLIVLNGEYYTLSKNFFDDKMNGNGRKTERQFYNTEQDCYVSESELRWEFNWLQGNDGNTYNYTFEEYIKNCTSKNGTLKEIRI